jgi:hypothetical protein
MAERRGNAVPHQRNAEHRFGTFVELTRISPMR